MCLFVDYQGKFLGNFQFSSYTTAKLYLNCEVWEKNKKRIKVLKAALFRVLKTSFSLKLTANVKVYQTFLSGNSSLISVVQYNILLIIIIIIITFRLTCS